MEPVKLALTSTMCPLLQNTLWTIETSRQLLGERRASTTLSDGTTVAARPFDPKSGLIDFISFESIPPSVPCLGIQAQKLWRRRRRLSRISRQKAVPIRLISGRRADRL